MPEALKTSWGEHASCAVCFYFQTHKCTMYRIVGTWHCKHFKEGKRDIPGVAYVPAGTR